MAESIETFVDKLKKEGVEAGQEAAEKIRSEAKDQARQIVEDARQEADEIVRRANEESKKIIEQGRTELGLALRDAIEELKSEVLRTLEGLLAPQVTETMQDEAFMESLIREVVMQYAGQDSAGELEIEINLPEAMADKLADKLMGELQKGLQGAGRINIRSTLTKAGFEYTIDEGTSEVVVDSVTEIMGKLVSPRLREVLDELSERGK